MYRQLFETVLLTVGIFIVMLMGLVEAHDYVSTVPGLVVTGEQDGQIFEYGVLKFDDGSGHIIMLLDRNLGAIITGGGSGAGTGSYGYKYSRGNNYGFEDKCRTKGCSDNTTNDATGVGIQWNSGYENRGYYGTIFVKGNYDYWLGNLHYDGLRGGSGDNKDNKRGLDTMTIDNIIYRQGPCPVGYHVPSAGEWNNLLKFRATVYTGIGNILTLNTDSNQLNNFTDENARKQFQKDFLIPFAGYRDFADAKLRDQESNTYLWSSSPNLPLTSARRLDLNSSRVYASYSVGRASADSVRCFYDFYLFPYHFSFMNGDVELVSGSIISGERFIDVINFNEIDVTKEGYNFYYWYIEGLGDKGFDFTGTIIVGDVILYAKRVPKEYKIDYEFNDGVISGENVTGYTIESEDITLIPPTKTGYAFIGRSGTDLDEFSTSVIIFAGSTGDRKYEANWEIKQYTITFKDGSGTESDVVYTGEYNSSVNTQYPAWTKDGYTILWDKEIPATMPLNGDTITASWTKNKKPSGGSSGGGGRNNKISSDSQISPDSSLSRGEEDSSLIKEGDRDVVEDLDSNTPMDSSTSSQNDAKTYSTEFQQAYEFAKEKGITTMPTINDANMNGKLTRIAMAKMLSYYAINVLGQKPANIVTPKFKDVTDKQNSDYDNGVTLAYQLGIMGQNMPNNKFRPNDEVTRAEFATALSRMLYNTSDGEFRSTPKYYIHHMEKLVKEGIITNDDPNMKELRGYVMIMLMRSSK